MRKTVLAVIAMCFMAVAAMAQNPLEQRAINKAEGAARQCIREGNYPNGLQLVSSAEAYQICDYANPNPNYFGYKVTVWGKPNCVPNQPCIQVIFPVATVYVDCGGQVTEIQCGVASE